MKISVHNAETGESIERDATVEEITQLEADAAFILSIQAEHEAKLQQKNDIATKLGLTVQELEILLG